jgi:ribonuclease Z
MIDCGPATTHKLVKAGLFPTQIGYLFFTHHHFDHDADYPCFLLTRWDQSADKGQQLRVWGPPPTKWITERLIGEEGAFSFDWKARVGAPASQQVFVNRGGTLPRPKPTAEVTELGVGSVVEMSGWKVTAAHAVHVQPWLESLAYRVDTPKGSVVFTGDTEYSQSIIDLAHSTDVLVANCWDHSDIMRKNGEILALAGTVEVAKMAQEAGAKKLVVTHIGPNLAKAGSREKGIAEIGEIYKGEVFFGEELTRLQLW